jgi:hypothetical protein
MLGSAGKYIGAEEPTPEDTEVFPNGSGAGVKGVVAPLAALLAESAPDPATPPSPQALAATKHIAIAKAMFAPFAAIFVDFRREFLKVSSPRADKGAAVYGKRREKSRPKKKSGRTPKGRQTIRRARRPEASSANHGANGGD